VLCQNRMRKVIDGVDEGSKEVEREREREAGCNAIDLRANTPLSKL